jgi:predicted PurR-regulated permease PerM
LRPVPHDQLPASVEEGHGVGERKPVARIGRGLLGQASAFSGGMGVLVLGAILAMLYLGRAVLVPVTLAVLLSFAIAPVVRWLRRVGLGHVSSVLVAVLALGAVLLALAGVIGVQTLQMASNASQYEATIKNKVQTLRSLTIARMEPVWSAAERFTDSLDDSRSGDVAAPAVTAARILRPASGAIPVEIHEPPPSPTAVLQRLLSAVVGPIGIAGIVVLVLIFVLLEQEALRDRFIRLASGGADLRVATTAINDAGERLSRFFVRQFAVNFSVGIAIGAALWAIGLPHAILWGALTAVLRFVPYLGVPLATFLASVLAIAVDPGWTMLLLTLGAFVGVQTIVSQVIEPRLYGHATGLSPLSIVLATLFWGWLWGPIGVIMSTPLTLCLAVAGRHAESLGFLDIVLGDGPALTMPQKFYQRALSGDAQEIIAGAREFLKRKPFATYCDTVLLPALGLGRVDLSTGTITPHQQRQLRNAVVSVIEALGSTKSSYKPPRKTLLEEPSPGRLLRDQRLNRQQRDHGAGKPDAALAGGSGSIVLCVGLDALGDDLAAELLVRILRDMHIDARHLSLEEVRAARPASVGPTDVSAVCIVSVDPRKEEETVFMLAEGVRATLPETFILALLLRDLLDEEHSILLAQHVDRLATSLEDAALEISERMAADTVSARPLKTA